MYWGSVRFFKHLFIAAFMLVLIGSISLAVYFKYENTQLAEELKTLKSSNFASLLYAQQMETESSWQHVSSVTDENNVTPNFDLDYQNLYPDLYVGDIPKQTRAANMVYLTFDDGPSKLTEDVLDVLKEKQIKATFFVMGKNLETAQGKETLKRIVREGHAVGIHTYSHVYSRIYASVEAFLDDFYKTYSKIYDITNVKPEIFRFPGGSINGYNSTIYKELIAEMARRGFVYYDWNISSQDAAGNVTKQQVYDNVVYPSKTNTRNVVLMHDSAEKVSTLKALPEIIDELTECGYQFDVLTRNVAPIIFGYSD